MSKGHLKGCSSLTDAQVRSALEWLREHDRDYATSPMPDVHIRTILPYLCALPADLPRRKLRKCYMRAFHKRRRRLLRKIARSYEVPQ